MCVRASIWSWVLCFTAVTYPSQPSFQYTLKQCCRKFSHIVALSEAFHCSAPSVTRSIDGCPVSLSQCFRKHQQLSDEVLTKGHRVEAMERRGADYWESEAGEKEKGDGIEWRKIYNTNTAVRSNAELAGDATTDFFFLFMKMLRMNTIAFSEGNFFFCLHWPSQVLHLISATDATIFWDPPSLSLKSNLIAPQLPYFAICFQSFELHSHGPLLQLQLSASHGLRCQAHSGEADLMLPQL